jgi:hypothetical protein
MHYHQFFKCYLAGEFLFLHLCTNCVVFLCCICIVLTFDISLCFARLVVLVCIDDNCVNKSFTSLVDVKKYTCV